jgi:uncharacterized membrane protein YphA (DoxX/SURF4 family)
MNSSKLKAAARILLGLIFVIFGLNGFLNFIPVPAPPEAGAKFLGALFETGYMFPMIKSIEILAGVALIAGYFAPLALLFLAPIIVNIFLYHLMLDPAGLVVPLILMALALFLGHQYRAEFKSVLKMK